MMGQIELAGVFVPSLLLLMLCAFVLTGLLRLVFIRIGLYHIVWHHSLFNFALYVIVLGGMVALTHW